MSSIIYHPNAAMLSTMLVLLRKSTRGIYFGEKQIILNNNKPGNENMKIIPGYLLKEVFAD